MDAKEIKSLLKESKEAIKNKDFQLALKSCKAVLKVDRNNYVALVLLGASLQESAVKDQAPNAFRKAIEVSPEQILAWQGLSSFYEKDGSEKNAEQLIPVYHRLLQMESDSNKWCEIIHRLEPLLIKTQNAQVLAEILKEYSSADDSEKQHALQQLTRNCLSEITVPDHLSALVKFGNFLCAALSSVNAGDCNLYFNLLYKQRLYETLIQSAVEFCHRYPDDMVARKWICKVFVEQFVENRLCMVKYKDVVPEHIELLLRNSPENVEALLAQGAMYMATDNYVEAREVLKKCSSPSKYLFHEGCLLSEVHFKLLNYTEAKKYAEIALSQNSPNSRTALMLLIKSLTFSDQADDWKRAIKLSQEHYSDDDFALLEYCARAYLKSESWTEFEQTIGKLQCNSTYAAVSGLLLAEARTKQGIAELTDSLAILADKFPGNVEIIYKLGLQYEEKKDYQSAHTMFIKAAQLAPHWYKIYLQLGYHYSQYFRDYDKARRCYQKAMYLNPDSDETGIALSDVFKQLGDVANNLTLLEVISKSRNALWAWLRLGLQHLEVGDSSAAIDSLRAALRTDPNHSHLWETLADAYLSRGAYTAALKSYEKVAKLRPGAFYPKLQIASIKQMTDLPEESLIEFRQLLQSEPNSVLALKGLSETCLCLAKNFLERRLLGLAKDRLQEGLIASASALNQKEDIACLWKIVGDIVTLAGQLPRSMASLEVPQNLCSPNQSELLFGVNLLQLGARFYVRALRQMGEKEITSFVWHDLAFNYRLQTIYLTEIKENQALSEKALACAKKSVMLAPNRWQHWNLLGIIAVLPGLKNYALAQHAFIKAAEADDTVPVPWSNLGTLYFMLKNVKLANQAFKFAQRVEPAYRQSWIGQALIAETVNHEDTMDLFRHTTELGFHPESCMGYAQWVCSTLQSSEMKTDHRYIYSIENMHALPVAIDSLTWATDFEEDSACGLNMLGCLFERCGQYMNAVQVLNRALQHAPLEHKDIVRGNLARVLLKSGNIQNAIKVYKSITKADFHSQCGLALSLFKGDQLEESFTTYESSLHWMVPDDASRSHLLVAMAAVSYKLNGVEKAKTLLFQCIQKIAPKSVHGLFAACALGMLNSDLVLSRAALKELEPFQDDPNYISHIAVFQAYVKYIQGQFKESVWSLSKTLHRQPWHASLWLNLALMLLQRNSALLENKHSASAAARCAQAAMRLGRDTMDVSKILAVVSLSHLINGDQKRALSASQHAVHLFPAVGESWAVLAASCHSCSEPTTLRLLLSHARQNLDLQRPLAKWMSNFERKLALTS